MKSQDQFLTLTLIRILNLVVRHKRKKFKEDSLEEYIFENIEGSLFEKNRTQGFTIVEALLGSLIFVIVSLAVFSTVILATRYQAKIESRTSLTKVMNSIIFQISSQDLNYPPFSNSTQFLVPGYDPFADANLSTFQCYNANGDSVTLDSPECQYNFSYYRVQIRDSKFDSNSDLAPLPMTRLNIKVQYKAKTGTGVEDKVLYMSRIFTSQLTQ